MKRILVLLSVLGMLALASCTSKGDCECKAKSGTYTVDKVTGHDIAEDDCEDGNFKKAKDLLDDVEREWYNVKLDCSFSKK